ncbi:NAD-dependent epimerase/dehydratase family protein [Pedobacter immunditicola]|uniref:NAD-dependent epimerase/dehydratase family protein n=1 Tax=Pedobacter immunditicola TaxID=3133440 RepID=UPI0030B4A923
MALHTILGANGTIATALLPVLKENNENIRLISRNPKPVPGTETIAADVLNFNELLNAVQGSSVIYLLVGITYDTKQWRREWPIIMRNVIAACKETKARLVFFDNVYMYGKVDGPMTEETPYNPCSEKGKVRAAIAEMLQQEMKAGTIKAVIARAVDFYGPGVTDKSAVSVMVFSRLKKGKSAQWFINPDVPRACSYTPDAAKAVYLLAKNDAAFGQVWHLPTAQPALTGRQFISTAAKYMNTSAKVTVLPKWLLKMLGWFNPFLKEIIEMTYQDEYPFIFDATKFEKAFNYQPVPYEQGIKETADWFLKEG